MCSNTKYGAGNYGRMTVNIDGITVWENAEEPAQPTEPTKPEKANTVVPKTGDVSFEILLASVLALALAAAAGLIVTFRKKASTKK